MNDSCWIIMTEKGIRRMAKGRNSNWKDVHRPKLDAGEYAVLISVEVPVSAFKPRALPSATVIISEESLIAAPVQVTVEDPPTGGATWRENELAGATLDQSSDLE